MTVHNEAKKEEISNKVIMTGDPLRAKYIVDNYFDTYEVVNKVRGNYVYTGYYKGIKITVMPSGMGIPSMGIYAYELFKFYDVDTIIKVGSCGSYKKDINLFDIVIANKTYSETNFDLTISNKEQSIVYPSKELNDVIINKAKELGTNVIKGNVICSECFDAYMDNVDTFLSRVPFDFDPTVGEMESYALFYLASKFNKKASIILTVSDIIGTPSKISSTEREKGLNKAITLALESIIEGD